MTQEADAPFPFRLVYIVYKSRRWHTSDKNTTERKKEETTDSNKGASDFKLGDSKSETPKKDDPASFDSKSDDRASDFKLEDKKR